MKNISKKAKKSLIFKDFLASFLARQEGLEPPTLRTGI